MNSPKILFIGATHGDESIGVKALCLLSTKIPYLDWIIGNPPAYKQNTRTFEGDLNRSAPGDMQSTQYASRRAAEILKKTASYDWIIDLHGAIPNCGIFILITKMTRENLTLAARLNISRIVYWPSISSELVGPLSEFFSCGLEIECGPKDSIETEEKLTSILETFIKEK
ncbi:MAG: succinylglutamate desuccinylase/aspartoacylase family protein, partial [Patescibacteria group bacterium]